MHVALPRAGAWLPLSLLLLAPGVSRAESGPVEADTLEHVQVTATRRSARDFDVAAAVSRTDQSSIRSEAPDVLAEMLRGLPGTYFQQTTPGQGIPIIRGLKGSQVLHLVDGMRLNNAFFRDAPNQYLGLVDAFAVDRVEVVRGAAGSLYGADAMGGVVNILTPEPVYGGAEWVKSGNLYGAFESADNGWIGRASAGIGQDGFGFTGGVTWQDRGDRRTGSGERVGPSGYRSESADLKLVATTASGDQWMFSAQALEQPDTPRIDELVPGYGQSQPSSEQYRFAPNRRTFVHGRYRHLGAGAWYDRVELHLARQTITDDRTSQDFGATGINRESNESVLDGLTVQLDSTLPGGHLLTWGGEYYTDRIASQRIRIDAENGSTSEVRSRFPDGSRMDSMAIFGRAEWATSGRLTVGAGARYSVFEIRLPAGESLAPVRLTPSDFTGDLNLLYAVSDRLHLVANLGRGFRPPNIFDLATLGPRPGNRFNVPNPDLGPESVWSYDLGLKFQSGDWQLELFGFYMDYRDKITSVATGETTSSGRAIVRSENRNQAILRGFEAGARWHATDRLELYSALNYTRGEERDDAGVTGHGDRIPPLNGRLGLRLEPAPDWSLEGHWLFAARQDRLSNRDVSDPRIDPEGTAGWGTLNLLARWQATGTIAAGLKLENLGDVRYREHGSGIDAPGRNLGVWLEAAW